MRPGGFHKRSRHAAMFVLALLALAVNVVVPSGYMPVRAADGSVVITLCTGQGLAQAQLAPDGSVTLVDDGSTGHDDQFEDQHGVCAFAGHGVAPTARDHPPVPARPEFLAIAGPAVAVRSLPLGNRMAAPPPGSHAPPSFQTV